MEFLHTKDPLFFNKPQTQNITLRYKQETLKLTYRVFNGDGAPSVKQKQKTKRLAPYEDNESKVSTSYACNNY